MNKISPQNAAIASPPGAAVGSDEDYSHKVQWVHAQGTSTLQGRVPFVLINTSIIELQSKGFIEGSQMSTNAENAANVNKFCAMYEYVSGIDPRGDRWYM